MKECLRELIIIMCPVKMHKFNNCQPAYCQGASIKQAYAFNIYSMALDKSTNFADTAELLIFGPTCMNQHFLMSH